MPLPAPYARLRPPGFGAPGGWLWLVLLVGAVALGARQPVGLPFVRSYALGEIGASRGAHLIFDEYERVGVISGPRCLVLNDNTWIERTEERENRPVLLNLQWSPEGQAYFSGLANWGTAQALPDGRLELTSTRPEAFPSWVRGTNFAQIVFVPGGVVFGGYYGLVYQDSATGATRFIELPELSCLFAFQDQIYASSLSGGLFRVDLETGERHPMMPRIVVDEVAQISPGEMLISTITNQLVRFDGEQFTPWVSPAGPLPEGSISAMTGLPEGGVAVAVDGQGVFVFAANGELLTALTTSEYERIFDLGSREPGVLWLATESSVQKVFYGTGISIIDQRSGVFVDWPQVIPWQDGVCVSSHGRLYELVRPPDSLVARLALFENQPGGGIYGVDAANGRMLVGNSVGLYTRVEDGFRIIMRKMDVPRVVMTDDNRAIIIGLNHLTLMRWDGQSWVQEGESVPGVGFPWIVHTVGTSIWIELGVDLAARITREGDTLRAQVFDHFSWEGSNWVNIGSVGPTVILSGPEGCRMYFDEITGQFVDAPELDRILQTAPEFIRRLEVDSQGRWWAAHENGVLVRDPEDGRWRNPFPVRFRDRYPILQIIGGEHVWISTESALYAVDNDLPLATERSVQPQLISIHDGRSGSLLYQKGHSAALTGVTYEHNHLVCHFFAGGYPSLQALSYAFTIRRGDDVWSVVSSDSILTLPNLWEGAYAIEAQLHDGDGPIGEPMSFAFRIAPPWFRTPWAYLGYALAALATGALFRMYFIHQANRKHARLERLVQERTEELRTTMERLTEEVRTSATLTERNRLAAEMHDSVQQGLSGLMLQIDATLRLGDLAPEVRSRLAVARKMISFTREEVQQAIWDLESPFLENGDLGDALRTMGQLVTSGTPVVDVTILGEAMPLDSSTRHHLLRVAQEALTNAMRHSHTDRIEVTLAYRADEVELTVRDFGIGFAADMVDGHGPGHFGLRGMRSRAAKIQGHWTLQSQPGQGTTISISVPNPTPTNA